MSTNGKGRSSGMIWLIIILMIGLIGSCGGESESSYERDVRSGFDKWSSGDYGSMTKSERKAVDNFLKWSNEN